jgi:hypothetical protein
MAAKAGESTSIWLAKESRLLLICRVYDVILPTISMGRVDHLESIDLNIYMALYDVQNGLTAFRLIPVYGCRWNAGVTD